MIIIEKPYISDFLKETLLKHNLPVLETPVAVKMLGEGNYNLIAPEELIKKAEKQEPLHIYTPSENAIQWIADNLHFTSLPEKIEHFKNKAVFRRLTRDLNPDFWFKEFSYDSLQDVDPEQLHFPLILKPSVGFFSMGVYRVENTKQWRETLQNLRRDLNTLKNLYPNKVMDASNFIAEEIIEGEEFAVDAYFNSNGEPVMLGMMKHIFASEQDVSDRVYFTSGKLIQKYYESFMDFIRLIGKRIELRNFPLHIELRVDQTGKILPIEVNPLRFGGWCTSADLMHKAYDFNPYLYFCQEREPDWNKLSRQNPEKMFSIVILDRPPEINPQSIKSFDYDNVLKLFEKPLELRKADFKRFPQFGFLFTETREENYKELENILKQDLKEFITV